MKGATRAALESAVAACGSAMPQEEWEATRETRRALVREVGLLRWERLSDAEADAAVREAHRAGVGATVTKRFHLDSYRLELELRTLGVL